MREEAWCLFSRMTRSTFHIVVEGLLAFPGLRTTRASADSSLVVTRLQAKPPPPTGVRVVARHLRTIMIRSPPRSRVLTLQSWRGYKLT